MIGTSPKSASRPPELKRCLTVTEESQCMHLQLVVQSYVESGRRLRPSARSKMRLTPTQFDAYADFAAVYATTLQDARLLATWTPEKEAAVKKAFMQKYLEYISARFKKGIFFVTRCELLQDKCLIVFDGPNFV